MRALALALALVPALVPAPARADCAEAEADLPARAACLSALNVMAEEEIAALVAEILSLHELRLPAARGAEVNRMLREAEWAWTAWRAAECKVAGEVLAPPEAAEVARLDCIHRLTRARIAHLTEAHLR